MVKGDECSLYMKEGTSLVSLFKKTTHITQNHGMGGQSSQRFNRKHDNEVQAYVKYMEERVVEMNKRHDFEQIYIAGNSDKKGKLLERLREEQPGLFQICKGITIDGSANVHEVAQIVEDTGEISAKSKVDNVVMERVTKMMETCPEKVRFGKKEIEYSIMVDRNLRELIVSGSLWSSWPHERCAIIKERLSECGGQLTIVENEVKDLDTMYGGMVGIIY